MMMSIYETARLHISGYRNMNTDRHEKLKSQEGYLVPVQLQPANAFASVLQSKEQEWVILLFYG
jgi:hypothetical protein